MADKFIRHGEPFNGDGTTSAAAASNGGVGAWNDIGILSGTTPAYGALAAGDIVYIRSKNAAGSDITIAFSAARSLGSAAATDSAPITWILDAGTVWASIVGTLTYAPSNTSSTTLLANNLLIAEEQDRIAFVAPAVNWFSTPILGLGAGAYGRRLLIDITPVSLNGPPTSLISSYAEATLEDCHWKCGTRFNALIAASNYSLLNVISPDIELLNAAETDPVFSINNYGACLRVLGGRVRGVGAVAGVSLVAGAFIGGGSYELLGLQYPQTMTISTGAYNQSPGARASSIGADSVMGSVLFDWAGQADSRDYAYLPTLNATTPGDSPVAWSIALRPNSSTSPARTLRLAPIAKMYGGVAAALTLTLELLVSTAFTGADKSSVYVVGSYIDDTTGESRGFNSKSTGALASSTAAWSATTYGADAFNKRRIQVVLPSNVKPDTPIFVQLIVTAPASDVSKYVIVCPDVQAS